MSGRNVSSFEMEIQSEIDRVLLAFHGSLNPSSKLQDHILNSLTKKSYERHEYELARKSAKNFLLQSMKREPQAWTSEEFKKLHKFFHADLPQKLYLSSR
jgi:hypothetical protein